MGHVAFRRTTNGTKESYLLAYLRVLKTLDTLGEYSSIPVKVLAEYSSINLLG